MSNVPSEALVLAIIFGFTAVTFALAAIGDALRRLAAAVERSGER